MNSNFTYNFYSTNTERNIVISKVPWNKKDTSLPLVDNYVIPYLHENRCYKYITFSPCFEYNKFINLFKFDDSVTKIDFLGKSDYNTIDNIETITWPKMLTEITIENKNLSLTKLIELSNSKVKSNVRQYENFTWSYEIEDWITTSTIYHFPKNSLTGVNPDKLVVIRQYTC